MACGMIAFQKLGIQIDNYYAYEVDKYAIQTVKHNFPNIQELGDVFNADFKQYEGIDYLIGGSPCVFWSIAQSPNKRETTASGMGWELFSQYVRALNEAKPKYFLYENNKSMAKAIYKSISETFGFEPICVNSALVSAQNRQRLYWVGKRNEDGTYSKVDIEQPEDKGILLKDILTGYNLTNRNKSFAYTSRCQAAIPQDTIIKHRHTMVAEPVGTTKDGKSYCLTQGYSNGSGENIGNYVTHTLEKGCKSMVAEPVRCFTLPREDGIQTQSKQYRVYDVCGKSTTLCAEGGGMGAKTGMYIIPIKVGEVGNGGQGNRIYTSNGKAVTQQANSGGLGSHTGLYSIPVEFEGENPVKTISGADGKTYTVYSVKDGIITIKGKQYPIKLQDGYYIIRKLTVSECKRLQTVPEWYEFPVSDTQAYKMLGNGWTVDVIAHLIKTLFYC